MPIEAQLHRANGALTTLLNGRHAWHADVDKTLGSGDLAPDPHDLLDSALAACTTLTLELYIRRRNMAVTDLRVTVERSEGTTESDGVRYSLTRKIRIEGDLADTDRQRLMEIAQKCPIHRILTGETLIHTEQV